MPMAPRILVLSLLAAAACAADRHVDPGHPAADDAGPGDAARPWRTLAPANGHAFAPGDRLLLRRGAVHAGPLAIDDAGTPDAPITVGAFGEGDAPTIVHHGLWSYAISVHGGARHVVVEDLALRGDRARETLGSGVQIITPAERVLLRRLDIADATTGVKLSADRNRAEDCFIHDLLIGQNTDGRATPDDPSDDDDDAGAAAFGIFNGRGNELVGNRIVRCSAPSHDFGTDGGAFEFYGVADGTVMERNRIERCCGILEIGGGEGEWAGSAVGARFVGNVCVDNNGLCFAIHLADRFRADVRDLEIAGNTFIETSAGRRAPGWRFIWSDVPLPPDAVRFERNIVVLEGIPALAHFDLPRRDNLYHFIGETAVVADGGAADPTERRGDPRFADPAAGDYRLRAGSPALGADGAATAGACAAAP